MHSFNVNPEHLMSEVYSYPFPEVREALTEVSLDPRFMLNTLSTAEAAGLLAFYRFRPELELPATADGSLNLDELHVPVIDRLRSIVGEQIKGLEGYDSAYPTPGSSQAMFTLMAEWHAKGKLESVAVLPGEYEGYVAYANALQIPVTRYEAFEDAAPKPGQVWFVSNPSARNGNWIDKDAWKQFTEAGHDIVYDAAYVGLTDPDMVDVSSPHIKAVLTSPSKLFGVFRYRNTGVAYTREPVTAMYGSKWFKDIPALLDTLTLYEQFGRSELVDEYRSIQAELCQALSGLVDIEVAPSDVLLLSNTAGPLDARYQRFMRAGGYRFGLTKLFEDYERQVLSPDDASA